MNISKNIAFGKVLDMANEEVDGSLVLLASHWVMGRNQGERVVICSWNTDEYVVWTQLLNYRDFHGKNADCSTSFYNGSYSRSWDGAIKSFEIRTAKLGQNRFDGAGYANEQALVEARKSYIC